MIWGHVCKEQILTKIMYIWERKFMVSAVFEALFFRYTSKVLGFIITSVEKHKLGRDSLSNLCENVNEIEH